jgi:hypothetical protein
MLSPLIFYLSINFHNPLILPRLHLIGPKLLHIPERVFIRLIVKGFPYGKVFLKCLLLYEFPYSEEKQG